MATGYDKILEQQKEMQKQVGKVHTHLMANSRVTSASCRRSSSGAGWPFCAAECTGSTRVRPAGAGCHWSSPAQNIGLTLST